MNQIAVDMSETLKGGEFLIKDFNFENIFTPEEWTEEQKMIAQSCSEFLQKEVFPNLDKIDSLEEGLMPSLLEKAGELGLLGISVPEEYGGFGKDFTTSLLSTEVTGAGHSFAVALSAHTGIGTLPILYYGNDEQKKKYIPKLASGEWKGCYCLTEPEAGSDANSGKTKAVLSKDGKNYILNGQKMWITNGGFADVFTVFAKIDDDTNLSAFIIEKNFEGLSLNPEEKKLGIKGSSTRQVFFNDCKVPVENLLSSRGEGFKIALNILNLGRVKLGAAALGGSKRVMSQSVEYANERKQFGTSISNFGAIKHKLAEQAIRIYALESATYRCSKDIDNRIDQLKQSEQEKGQATLKGIEEFAVEAAILKIFGSEVLDFVVDEGVQIYGGMGYSAEAPMERAYRDARINRIFEGTNEINRMLIIDMLIKKTMKGELDLLGPAKAVGKELTGIPDFSSGGNDELLGAEKKLIKNFKKAALMTAGAAVQKLMMTLKDEQEILMNLADIITETYVAESTLLRVEKSIDRIGETESALQLDIVRTYLFDAADRIHKSGKDALTSFGEGDELKMMLMGLKRFTKAEPFNTKNARRRISKALTDKGSYCF